jgi:uncharacterized protein
MNLLAALCSGLLFGCGLVLSGMTDPMRVLAFLDVAGDWDPSLALVMGTALAVYTPLMRLIARRPRPLAADGFEYPKSTRIDGSLLSGAALFGAGWGLSGFCPAPALAAASAGTPDAVVFSIATIAGMLLFRATSARLGARGGDPDRIARVSDA